MKPRIARLDGTQADTSEDRLLDVIFGVQGACERCLPKRVPAVYEMWESVVGQLSLDNLSGPGSVVYPYSDRSEVCAACVADARAYDQAGGDGPGYEVHVAKVSTLIHNDDLYVPSGWNAEHAHVDGAHTITGGAA